MSSRFSKSRLECALKPFFSEKEKNFRPSYNLTIIATAPQIQETLRTTLNVRVLNVNDNPPTVQAPSRRRISEGSPTLKFQILKHSMKVCMYILSLGWENVLKLWTVGSKLLMAFRGNFKLLFGWINLSRWLDRYRRCSLVTLWTNFIGLSNNFGC